MYAWECWILKRILYQKFPLMSPMLGFKTCPLSQAVTDFTPALLHMTTLLCHSYFLLSFLNSLLHHCISLLALPTPPCSLWHTTFTLDSQLCTPPPFYLPLLYAKLKLPLHSCHTKVVCLSHQYHFVTPSLQYHGSGLDIMETLCACRI